MFVSGSNRDDNAYHRIRVIHNVPETHPVRRLTLRAKGNKRRKFRSISAISEYLVGLFQIARSHLTRKPGSPVRFSAFRFPFQRAFAVCALAMVIRDGLCELPGANSQGGGAAPEFGVLVALHALAIPAH